MTLNNAIKFRHLADQLTATERVQFVNKLLNNPNNIIFTSLFNHFIKSSENQNNTDLEVQNINKLLSNIINSREKKEKSITTNNVKLEYLPKELIGATASFLDQYDYINLSKTNRSVFLGCNSPNLMQELYLVDTENYAAINLALYPSVKSLKLNVTKLNQLKPPINGAAVHQCQSLTFFADSQNDAAVDALLTQNYINCSNVTTLCCEHFGSLGTPFDATKFFKLLAQFPNLQYLDLTAVECDIDANKIKAIYPNLRGLHVILYNDTTNRDLIHAVGEKLDFLTFCQLSQMDYNLSSIDFSKLEELRVFKPTTKSINDIIKTALNLIKVRIDFVVDVSFMNSNDTKPIIMNLILKCKSLEYMEFKVCDKLIESTLEGVEKGLFQTKMRKRKELKIKINAGKECKISHYMLNIGNIINWLERSQVDNFMFVLDLTGSKNLKNVNDKNMIKKELQSLSSEIKVNIFSSMFIISNKNCKINGYNESWKV